MATLSIDKSNWELVKLGDVAHEVRESLTKSNIQVDRSVGLEHIEPGDLHIRTWDELDESSSFTKVFREGHVLFGRRRAYLKKAALADFNGVCSGDITVISAREDLLPSLLPFVVSSDRFFAFAVEHSAGGLSPRVKWKDLANYEFLLPPKDEQAEIAELLLALQMQKEEYVETEKCLINLRLATESKAFQDFAHSENKIEDVVILVTSGVTPRGGSKVYQKSGVRFIRSQNVLRRSMDLSDIKYISHEIHEGMARSKVQKDDVLLNITGASIGRAAKYSDEIEANVNQHVCILRTGDNIQSDLLVAFLNSTAGQLQIIRHQSGGSREGLNYSQIRRMKIPKAVVDVDAEISEQLSLIQKSLKACQEHVSSSSSLAKAITHSIFDDV